VGGIFSTHGEMRNTYKILLRKLERKIMLERCRYIFFLIILFYLVVSIVFYS